ncbi:MAG: MaoC/PaaZ C-terminal domain-containing protein [Caulobacter sp.]|nr:MaoC/PaaZ C-terminal domain-containing protein [Caulobacter sp.]
MPIAYPEILTITSEPQPFAWTDRETMLYALGVGMGADPMNEQELPFVYESGLKAVPTMATTVAWGAGPSLGKMGINFLLVVHGEQKVEFHKPFPSEAEITAEGRILGVYDKGDKGAVIYVETTLKDARSGEAIATLTGSTFARGDGNFGGPSDGAPEPHAVPARAPDLSLDFATRPDQALIYRLSGDRNPLHADPKFAKAAGFPRPILHGLCTYGITCRAVLQAYADFDPARIKSHQVRFSSPVFPGETITVDLWKDGDVVSFEARVKDRGVTVVKNGKTTLG